MRVRLLIASAVLALAACEHKPTLPDPTVELTPPPAALMVAPEPLKTIPQK